MPRNEKPNAATEQCFESFSQVMFVCRKHLCYSNKASSEDINERRKAKRNTCIWRRESSSRHNGTVTIHHVMGIRRSSNLKKLAEYVASVCSVRRGKGTI